MKTMPTKYSRIYQLKSMKNIYIYLKKKSNMIIHLQMPIQPIIILEIKKRPNWLKYTLEDVKEIGATKGYFR